jgi:VWFA-related protein
MLHRRSWIALNLSATALLISLNCIFVDIMPAQQESSEIAQSPTRPLRVATRLVQINVIVNDKRGNPIEGLTKNDFELFDNKKKQEIRVLSAHSNRPLDPLSPPLPLDTFTNKTADAATPENVTVILLDSLNTEFADQVLARKHVVKFLRQLRSNDHVALYWLSNNLYVLHDFTTDAASLRETLASFGGESNHALADSKVEDPSLNNPNASIPAGRMSSREAFRRAFDQRVANESTKDRVRLTVAALIAIARHIGPINGRKNLVWVSGSFPFDLGNDKFDLNWANDTGTSFSEDIEMAARAVTDANIAVYPVDARGLMGDEISATQGSGDEHPEFSSEGDEHLPTHATAGNIDTMKTLAERTGGKAFYNTNDLSGSIRRALDDSRSTYTLAYYPSEMTWDGSFHNVKVKVRTTGADVRARAGYFAIPDSGPTSGKNVKAIISQAALSPLDATGIGVRVQIKPPNTSDASILIANLHLDLNEIHMERNNGIWNGVIQTVFLQLDSRGKIIHADDKVFKLSLPPDVYDQTLKQGVSETERIQVLQSSAQLRVVVRDPWNGNLGSVAIPLPK